MRRYVITAHELEGCSPPGIGLPQSLGRQCKYVSRAMLTEACCSISESTFGLRRARHEGIMLVVERDVSL